MWKIQKDVEEFQHKFGFRIGAWPGHPPVESRRRRVQLISEESRELMTEIARPDGKLHDIGQELVDDIYVAVGTAVEYGIDLEPIWNAVHGANMKKIANGTNKPKKPDGWTKPNVEKIIAKQLCRRWRIRIRSKWGFRAYTDADLSLAQVGFHVGPLEVVRLKKCI